MKAPRLAAVIAPCVIACHSRPADYGHPSRDANFRGVLSYGFEHSGFIPCGSKDVWWWDIENPDDAAWLHVDALHDRSCEISGDPYCGLVYAELDASLSPPGHYGHLGMYDRLMIVSRVRYASLTIPGQCEVPGDALLPREAREADPTPDRAKRSTRKRR
jgi:hypothetical protein